MIDLYGWTDSERDEIARRERNVQRRMRVCIHTIGTIDYSREENAGHMHICKAGEDWRTHRVEHDDTPAPAMWPPDSPRSWDPQPLTLHSSVPCTDTLNTGCASCPKRQTMTRDEAVEYVKAEYGRIIALNDGRPR